MPEKSLQETYQQHPIPQNVLGVEFKLVGALTMRQFLYVAVAVVIAYLIYSATGLIVAIRYPLSLIIALTGLAAAFLPIQNQTFDKWVGHFVGAITSPTQRVWRKAPSPPEFFYLNYRPVRQTTVISPVKDRARLEEYLKHLRQGHPEETELNELDRQEQEFQKRLGLTPLKTAPRGLPPAAASNYRPFERPRGQSAALNLASEVSYANAQVINMPQGGYLAPITNTTIGRKLHAASVIPEGPAPVRGELEFNSPKKPGVVDSESLPSLSPEEREAAIKKELQKLTTRLEEVRKDRPPIRPPVLTAYTATKLGSPLKVRTPLSPKIPPAMSEPDREKQRQENSAFQRGVDIKKRNALEAVDLNELSRRYQASLSQLRNQGSLAASDLKKTSTDVERMKVYAGEMSVKNVTYSRELQEQEARLEKLTFEKSTAEANLKRTEEELQRLKLSLSPAERKAEEIRNQVAGMTPPIKSRIPLLVKDTPNVVNGIVKDHAGELLEGAVVIVKDSNGEPVRALKSNQLGQFIIATPLTNGRYTTEVTKSGEIFDIMTVDVAGTVLPPLEFIGRVSSNP